MKIQTKTALAALGLAGVLLAGSASAATLAGSNVSFSFDDTQLGLFGTASIVDGNLVFAPTSFLATGTTPATQSVNITVTAQAGYFLSGFSLVENGGYKLPGAGDMVWLQGNFTALDIEGNTSQSIASNIVGPSFTAGTQGSWQGGAALAIPATGWGGADGLVTRVSLTLNNQLFAMGAGEIWKNAITIEAIATPVPEAETYAMMLAGLGLVGFMARRRRAHLTEAGPRG